MAFLLLRLLFGALILLATLVAAAAAAILAARVAPEPLAFLGAGLLVLVVGTAAAAFVGTAGRSVSVVRRRLIAAASVVVAAVVVGALMMVPLGDPAVPPTPIPGMELADLPSGSRIAYVRVPGDPSGASSGDEPIVVLHGGPGVADMPNDPFATMGMFGHEAGSLQHGDVLLHGSERHVVGARQLRDRCLAAEGPSDDVASRRIGERPEDPVDLAVTELHCVIYNHMVAC